MRIYWELPQIPRPENSYIGKADGRVYILSNPNLTFRKNKRIVIGRASGDSMMYPNTNFKIKFPSLWEQYYSQPINSRILYPGMYALSLGIGYQSNLYPLLIDAIGEYSANFVFDFSMYSIQNKSNVASLFQESMKRQVVFSRKTFSDTKVSDFLEEEHLNIDNTMEFRDSWMKHCAKNGVKKVWLSLDGSNNDCNAKKCSLAQKGHAKSKKNTPIIGYMYAINIEDGMPVTYTEYPGNQVDSKAFMKIINMLAANDIEVEGVILDRGFATASVIDLLESIHYKYIVMLKSNSLGSQEMVKKFSDGLQWDGEYVLNEDLLCGVTEKQKIFASSDHEAFINLYFNSTGALGRTKTLFRKIFNIDKELKQALKNGKEYKIPKEFKNCFIVNEEEKTVLFDFKQLTRLRHVKGLASIASSEDFGPLKTNNLYHLRDCSETQYGIIKTQLGAYVTRSQSTTRIRNRFFITFISSILRCSIMNACKRYGYDTNKVIQKISEIEMLLDKNENYWAIHNENSQAKRILSSFDIDVSDFDIIANEVEARKKDPSIGQIRLKPTHPKKRKRGNPRPRKPKEDKPKGKPGRPLGSKNKKKKKVIVDDIPKRKTGRPLGSKNKKKMAATVRKTKEKPNNLTNSEDNQEEIITIDIPMGNSECSMDSNDKLEKTATVDTSEGKQTSLEERTKVEEIPPVGDSKGTHASQYSAVVDSSNGGSIPPLIPVNSQIEILVQQTIKRPQSEGKKRGEKQASISTKSKGKTVS